MEEIKAILKDQGEILKNHDGMFQEIKDILKDHSTILKEHGQKFDRFERIQNKVGIELLGQREQINNIETKMDGFITRDEFLTATDRIFNELGSLRQEDRIS